MIAAARAVPVPGAVRMRRALALALGGVLSLAVTACESTEQESARIGRESQAAAQGSTAPASSSSTRARSRNRLNRQRARPPRNERQASR